MYVCMYVCMHVWHTPHSRVCYTGTWTSLGKGLEFEVLTAMNAKHSRNARP